MFSWFSSSNKPSAVTTPRQQNEAQQTDKLTKFLPQSPDNINIDYFDSLPEALMALNNRQYINLLFNYFDQFSIAAFDRDAKELVFESYFLPHLDALIKSNFGITDNPNKRKQSKISPANNSMKGSNSQKPSSNSGYRGLFKTNGTADNSLKESPTINQAEESAKKQAINMEERYKAYCALIDQYELVEYWDKQDKPAIIEVQIRDFNGVTDQEYTKINSSTYKLCLTEFEKLKDFHLQNIEFSRTSCLKFLARINFMLHLNDLSAMSNANFDKELADLEQALLKIVIKDQENQEYFRIGTPPEEEKITKIEEQETVLPIQAENRWDSKGGPVIEKNAIHTEIKPKRQYPRPLVSQPTMKILETAQIPTYTNTAASAIKDAENKPANQFKRPPLLSQPTEKILRIAPPATNSNTVKDINSNPSINEDIRNPHQVILHNNLMKELENLRQEYEKNNSDGKTSFYNSILKPTGQNSEVSNTLTTKETTKEAEEAEQKSDLQNNQTVSTAIKADHDTISEQTDLSNNKPVTTANQTQKIIGTKAKEIVNDQIIPTAGIKTPVSLIQRQSQQLRTSRGINQTPATIINSVLSKGNLKPAQQDEALQKQNFTKFDDKRTVKEKVNFLNQTFRETNNTLRKVSGSTLKSSPRVTKPNSALDKEQSN